MGESKRCFDALAIALLRVTATMHTFEQRRERKIELIAHLQPWIVQSTIPGKQAHLCSFDTPAVRTLRVQGLQRAASERSRFKARVWKERNCGSGGGGAGGGCSALHAAHSESNLTFRFGNQGCKPGLLQVAPWNVHCNLKHAICRTSARSEKRWRV